MVSGVTVPTYNEQFLLVCGSANGNGDLQSLEIFSRLLVISSFKFTDACL